MTRILRSLLAVVLLTSPALAQTNAQQAQLRITVVDQTKLAIAAATVKITRPDATVTEVVTDERGQVTLQALPIAAVQVHVEFAGFEPFDAPLTLRRGTNDATVTLLIAGFQEQVEVADTAATDDRTGNSLTTTLNEAEIAELPDDPDQLREMLEQMTGGAGATFQVNGFRGGELPPRDEIRQIRFRVNSFSADGHDAGRVQIQIITRPNVTAWSGNVNLGYRSDAMNARNAFAREQTPEQFRRFSTGIRGPLVSGRTSIRLNVDGNRSFDSDTIVARLGANSSVASQFRRPTEATNVTLGIEHGLTADQTLRFEYRGGRDSRDNQGVGGFNLLDRAYSREGSDHQMRLSSQGLFAGRILSESRLQLNFAEDITASFSDEPSIRVIDAFTSGGAGQSSRNITKQMQFANDTDFSRGVHVMRTGFLLDVASYQDNDARNYNGTFTFSSLEALELKLPDTYTQRLGRAQTQFSYYQLGIYFQDDIRVNRTLSLSFGVRQEMQSFIDDSLNFMPRVGFTWNPGGSRTAIRGGYGMFYDWYAANLHDQTLRVNGELQQDLTILNPSFPDPTGTTTLTQVLPSGRVQAAPDLQMPYVQQFSIGIDQPLSTTVTLQSSYQWSRGYNQLRSRNINAPNAEGIRPDPTAGTITQIESTGRTVSDRVTMNANYRIPARQIFLNLGYTWSNVKSHSNGATALPADSYNQDAEWGPSGQDIRHRLFTTINYTAPYGFRLNLTNNYSSAPPYTITTGSDDNRDGVSNDRPAGVGRNTERGAPRLDTNLRVSRSLSFGGLRAGGGGDGGRGGGFGGPGGGGPGGGGPRGGGGGGAAVAPAVALQAGPGGRGGGGGGRAGGPGGGANQRYTMEFYANVSNLFNRVNYGGFSGNLRSPFFGQATSAGQARRIEIGTNFRF